MIRISFYCLIVLSAIGSWFAAGIDFRADINTDAKLPVNQLQTTSSFSTADLSLIYEMSKGFENNTQISIGLLDGDEATYYGLQRRNDTLFNEFLESTVFEIGSITKVMTAHVMSAMVEAGELQMNASILDYLPIENEFLRPITIQHLANHTSGLPRLPNNMGLMMFDPYKDYDATKLMTFLEGYDKGLEIGKSSTYSNLGFGVLGHILELVSGKSLESLFQEYIFVPLNMANSSSDLNTVKGLAKPGKSSWGLESYYWEFDVMAGAGAVRSSTDQMLRYIANLRENKPAIERLRKETYQEENFKIGNALMINESQQGGKIYWHNGGTGGFRSCMAFNIEEKIAVVILSNVNGGESNSDNIDALCFDLLRSRLKN